MQTTRNNIIYRLNSGQQSKPKWGRPFWPKVVHVQPKKVGLLAPHFEF